MGQDANARFGRWVALAVFPCAASPLCAVASPTCWAGGGEAGATVTVAMGTPVADFSPLPSFSTASSSYVLIVLRARLNSRLLIFMFASISRIRRRAAWMYLSMLDLQEHASASPSALRDQACRLGLPALTSAFSFHGSMHPCHAAAPILAGPCARCAMRTTVRRNHPLAHLSCCSHPLLLCRQSCT